jgi:hypothetical protein
MHNTFDTKLRRFGYDREVIVTFDLHIWCIVNACFSQRLGELNADPGAGGIRIDRMIGEPEAIPF